VDYIKFITKLVTIGYGIKTTTYFRVGVIYCGEYPTLHIAIFGVN